MTAKNPYQFKAEMHPRMEQRLKLSFQQIQNMDILLLPALELTERIYQELEQNPTLEISDEAEPTVSEDKETPPVQVPEQPPVDADSPETVVDVLDQEREPSYSQYWNRGEVMDAKIEAMQNTPDRPESLQDYLYFQFLLMELSEEMKALGKDIIYNIDDNGFLKTPVEGIAQAHNVSAETVESALQIIRKLDPPGAGSKNLAEYLLMQLPEDDKNSKLKRLLIGRYFDQLQPYKLPALAKTLNKPLEDIQKAVDEIKMLNPHPSAGFSSENIPYIMPDVIIVKIEDNYEIKVQSEYFPSLVISRHYQELLADKNTDDRARNFIRDKINAARGLLQAIQLRKITLREVARQIIFFQRDFFDNGIKHLKPLMMKEVAVKLGVHLSTISRVLANKYVQTPHGLFSMKFFFSSTSETAKGDFYAQPAIMAALKEVIEKEDKEHPLSDIQITDALKARNFVISRRTVAKYRDMIEIPNQSQRKNAK
ncbi:MAG: RNA polymerase factor sigma-54 [Planctomycetota bacterium]